MFQNWIGIFYWNMLSHLVSPKINNIGLGGHGHVRYVRKPWKMRGFRICPKWILKVISLKWSRIILRSFWANLLIKCIIKTVPKWLQNALIIRPMIFLWLSYDFPCRESFKLWWIAIAWVEKTAVSWPSTSHLVRSVGKLNNATLVALAMWAYRRFSSLMGWYCQVSQNPVESCFS